MAGILQTRRLTDCQRIFAYYRWTKMPDKEPTPDGPVTFHTALELPLMAHSPS